MSREVFLIYVAASYIIFKKVYETSQIIIDEEFHIPQGLAYCNFNFSAWDTKITTLPGLYVISTVFLGPLNLCNTYWLRFTSLVAGIINTALFHVAFSKLDKSLSKSKICFSSINLSLLPPLFFFNNLYYTDVVSLTSILAVFLLALSNKHVLACICGVVSVLIRQTNIIWIGLVFGDYALKNFYHYCLQGPRQGGRIVVTEKNIKLLSFNHLRNVFKLRNVPVKVYCNIISYLCLFLGFALFVLLNGGIVVGDKSAHVAVIHIPQIFYFSLFCLIFGWPHFILSVVPCYKFVLKRKLFVLFFLSLAAYFVYTNTLVHPYLLADNRHYTFYIWNRLYEKIPIFRYVIIPVYFFGFYCIISSIYSVNDVTLPFLYILCTVPVLILQKMIEVRYFLVPFVLLRLGLGNVSNKILIIELIYYVVINALFFRIFFVKDIYWSDFDYVQKLIW